jgi:hypothetical protein
LSGSKFHVETVAGVLPRVNQKGRVAYEGVQEFESARFCDEKTLEDWAGWQSAVLKSGECSADEEIDS